MTTDYQTAIHQLFGRMMRGSKFDHTVVQAIHLIRATNRYRIISVTNNFGHSIAGISQSEFDFLGWSTGDGSASPAVRGLFDDYIDSSEVGLRLVQPHLISPVGIPIQMVGSQTLQYICWLAREMG
jgi:hypothetical protein